LTIARRFKIAGAIAQVEKKFTKKEGKPFAVVWLEDLMDMLEVVVWNEVYLKVSDILVPWARCRIESNTGQTRRNASLRRLWKLRRWQQEDPMAKDRKIHHRYPRFVSDFLRRPRAMSCARSAKFSSAHRTSAGPTTV